MRVSSVLFGGIELAAILIAPAPRNVLGLCIGLALYGLSLAFFAWTLRTHRDRPLSAIYSPDLPRHLVREGAYRWVRQPFYASYLMMWAAGVFAAGNAWLSGIVLAMSVLYYRAAQQEENKFMRSELSSAYQDYQRRTGMFFPSF